MDLILTRPGRRPGGIYAGTSNGQICPRGRGKARLEAGKPGDGDTVIIAFLWENDRL